MRAVVIVGAGGPEVLQIQERPRPEPRGREVLVRVRASALNRADLLQRRGMYPAPPDSPPDIPGIEFTGEIAARGARARRCKVGDRVFGITGGGAHAEYLLVDERLCAQIPDNLDWQTAAAVPEVFITAHDALITQSELVAGERVVVTAVGSGVGLAAVSIAKLVGASIFGTTRTADKLERAKAFGLDEGFVTATGADGLPPAVQAWTGGAGANIGLDLVGGPFTEALIQSLGLKSRLMIIGTVAGGSVTISAGSVLRKRMTIRGTALRSRSISEKAAATRAFERDIVPALARGEVKPVIDFVGRMDRIAEAHARLEGNETFGKVVLLGFDD